MAAHVWQSVDGYWYCREFRHGARELVSFGRGPDAERLARLATDRVNEDRIGECFRQERQCAICGSTARLRLDHCHARNQWRGRLCDRCNKGLGFFRDDPALLRLAALYVETHDQRRAQALRFRRRGPRRRHAV